MHMKPCVFMNNVGLRRHLFQFIQMMMTYLTSLSEGPVWAVEFLRVHFCDTICYVAQLAYIDNTSCLDLELRRKLFHLLCTWCGFGPDGPANTQFEQQRLTTLLDRFAEDSEQRLAHAQRYEQYKSQILSSAGHAVCALFWGQDFQTDRNSGDELSIFWFADYFVKLQLPWEPMQEALDYYLICNNDEVVTYIDKCYAINDAEATLPYLRSIGNLTSTGYSPKATDCLDLWLVAMLHMSDTESASVRQVAMNLAQSLINVSALNDDRVELHSIFVDSSDINAPFVNSELQEVCNAQVLNMSRMLSLQNTRIGSRMLLHVFQYLFDFENDFQMPL